MQRDAVSSHLDSGKTIDEQGVEDAFELLYEIKEGTEYFDAKSKRYVDFPIIDILQMMGRAGRDQYDQQGKAIILVHGPKNSFYKKVVNPANYGLEFTDPGTLSSYLSSLMVSTFEDLEDSGCIKMDEEGVEPMMLGSVASQYYLKYTTLSMFASNIEANTSLEVFIHVLSGASEYDELPVRHNKGIFVLVDLKAFEYDIDRIEKAEESPAKTTALSAHKKDC
ncbi:hypothetical protein OROMI_025412 [Orobanche minor]